jgi:hypothetical protein
MFEIGRGKEMRGGGDSGTEERKPGRGNEENPFIVFCPRKRTTAMVSSKVDLYVYKIDLAERKNVEMIFITRLLAGARASQRTSILAVVQKQSLQHPGYIVTPYLSPMYHQTLGPLDEVPPPSFFLIMC